MRQLTAFASYFDNLGALLNGRARFYNSDGSPAVVYAWDNAQQRFVENGSIVFTNSSGQLEPQVFLGNHDYLIVFDKYIGNARMTEDDDSESWEEQGSAIDKYNTIGIELSGGAIRAVSTIANLRQTQGLANFEVIELMGYYESGDKPIVYYKWNPFISTADNGGSIIKVDDVAAGRWELVSCPEYLDVRHFGAFPMQGIEENADQRYNLTNAYTYAHSQGCGVYFWADDTHAYYDISGANLIKVDSHPLARLFCVENISGTSISDIKEVHLVGQASEELATGLITLQGEVVRTSWGEETGWVVFDPSVKLVMDAAILATSRTWKGIEVEILAYTSGCVFTDCLITSNGKIDKPVTIADCEIKQEWFAEDYNWADLTSDQNDIRLNNFKDANTYIVLKNKQNENDYGDLGESTISNVTLLSGCIAENAAFTDVTLAGNSELHNISGNVLLTGTTPNHNWIDCWMTITSVSGAIGSFQFRRGDLTSASTLTIVQPSVFVDVSINAELDCRSDLKLDRCEINKPVKGIRLNAIRNDIFSTLSIQMESGRLEGTVNCNRFFDGGYLAVIPLGVAPGTTPRATVAISITGNYSDHDFWDDSAFNGVSHTTTGKIVYEGNYGGCPGNEFDTVDDMTFSIVTYPYNAPGDITDLPAGQGDNTIFMIVDQRRVNNAYDQKQFWWSVKIHDSIDLDSIGIWRCKHLLYGRTVSMFTEIVSRADTSNSGILVFNFNLPMRTRVVSPLIHEISTDATYTFQETAQSVQNDAGTSSMGKWVDSRFASLIPSSTSRVGKIHRRFKVL